MARMLHPFWCYYGGKHRLAPSYPPPLFRTIVEPFAGAAGYSLRYPDRKVVLVERYHVIAEIWRFLIAAKASEVLSIPCVDNIDDLPLRVPQGARWLVGFAMNNGTTTPRRTLSSGLRKLRAQGRRMAGWTEDRRAMVASQVSAIRHWRVIEGDYTAAPDIEATWFVDPPYSGHAGRHYVHGPSQLSYTALALWAATRRGQVIACESLGAEWLPFSAHADTKAGPGRNVSREAVWLSSPIPNSHTR